MALRAAQGNEDARETRPWAFEGPRPRWSIEEAAWVGGRRRPRACPTKQRSRSQAPPNATLRAKRASSRRRRDKTSRSAWTVSYLAGGLTTVLATA